MNHGMNKCRAAGCNKVINVRVIMCAEHWHLVPKDIKQRIYKYGRHGTEEAYNQAVHDAIEAVNEEMQKRNAMGISHAFG